MCHPLFLLLCLSFGHPLPDALTSVLFLPFLLSRPCPFRCPSSLTWPPRLCSQREPSSRSGDTATERWRRPPFHRAPAVIPTPWLMPPLMPPSPAHWPVSLTAIPPFPRAARAAIPAATAVAPSAPPVPGSDAVSAPPAGLATPVHALIPEISNLFAEFLRFALDPARSALTRSPPSLPRTYSPSPGPPASPSKTA